MDQHALPAELHGAIGDVAASFDHATVGREIGVVAVNSIPPLSKQLDTEVLEETVLAATSNVVAITDGLLNRVAPDKVPVPTVSLHWVDWLVARNIDVSAIPWAYSFGNGRMADALREVVGQLNLTGEQRWALGEGLTRYVQTYVESVSAQLVDRHERAHEKWSSGLEAYRRSVVQRLVAGELVDLGAAGRDLNYDLEGWHLAAIVWPSADAGHSPPTPHALEGSADLLLRSCGAERVLSVSHPDGSVWAWGHGSSLTDLLGDRLLAENGMLGAIGTVSAGPRGFAGSHADAQRAKRVALMLDSKPRSVVGYRSVALTSLIAQDPEQALRFVESELGPLTENTESARRLRSTLATYLDEGMRPVRTARRLGVHQNTVAYRVTQAEEAIGRSLAERRLELETALRLAEALDALRFSADSRQH